MLDAARGLTVSSGNRTAQAAPLEFADPPGTRKFDEGRGSCAGRFHDLSQQFSRKLTVRPALNDPERLLGRRRTGHLDTSMVAVRTLICPRR